MNGDVLAGFEGMQDFDGQICNRFPGGGHAPIRNGKSSEGNPVRRSGRRFLLQDQLRGLFGLEKRDDHIDARLTPGRRLVAQPIPAARPRQNAELAGPVFPDPVDLRSHRVFRLHSPADALFCGFFNPPYVFRGLAWVIRKLNDEVFDRIFEFREVIDEVFGLIVEFREVIDEDFGLIVQFREVIDEDFGLIVEFREVIDEVFGLIIEFREVIDEDFGLIIEFREVIDEVFGLIIEFREVIDEVFNLPFPFRDLTECPQNETK